MPTASQQGRRNKRAGKQRESEHAARMLADGWEVAKRERINGDEAGYDYLCCRDGEVVLDQVKSTVAGSFASHGPAKRAAHIEAARRAGGSPRVIWAPFDRKPPRIFPLETWPTGRTTGRTPNP